QRAVLRPAGADRSRAGRGDHRRAARGARERPAAVRRATRPDAAAYGGRAMSPRPRTPAPARASGDPPARPLESPERPPSYLDAQARAGGRFRLVTDFQAQGDQAQAIDKLVEGLRQERRDQVLLGVTGSGKTFTVAKVVEAVNRPTLVLSHNKTLAAQL